MAKTVNIVDDSLWVTPNDDIPGLLYHVTNCISTHVHVMGLGTSNQCQPAMHGSYTILQLYPKIIYWYLIYHNADPKQSTSSIEFGKHSNSYSNNLAKERWIATVICGMNNIHNSRVECTTITIQQILKPICCYSCKCICGFVHKYSQVNSICEYL